jgi:hypothetical protein
MKQVIGEPEKGDIHMASEAYSLAFRRGGPHLIPSKFVRVLC